MKRVYGNSFVHREYVEQLSPEEQALLRDALQLCPPEFAWNVVRVNQREGSVTFSLYPDFDVNPHPAQKQFVRIDTTTSKVTLSDRPSSNPPILHRKELFVDQDYPHYEKFRWLTEQEELAGLLTKGRGPFIGRRSQWESLLASKGFRLEGHRLVPVSPADIGQGPNELPADLQLAFPDLEDEEDRRPFAGLHLPHLSARTAIHRKSPSKPVRLAIEKGLIHGRVFDWGCGHGSDLDYLRELGFDAHGWDPNHRPANPPESYPPGTFHFVLNIYVLNTIRRIEVREHEILHRIYNFLDEVGHLYIATRTSREVERLAGRCAWQRCGDGWLTKRGTFQKGFLAAELVTMLTGVGFTEVQVEYRRPLIVLATKSSTHECSRG